MRNRLIAVVTSAVAGVALSTVLVAPAQAGPAGHEDPGEPGVSVDVTGILGGLLGGGVSIGAEGGGKAEGDGGHEGGDDKGGHKGKGRDKDKGRDKGHDKGKGKDDDKDDDKDGYEAGAGAAFLIEGTIRAIDKRTGIVIIQGVKEGGVRVTQRVKISAGASLRLDGAATVLGKIAVGAQVRVNVKKTVSGSLRLATSVHASTSIKIKGTVAAVDAASGKLTVVARGGKRAHGKTTIKLKANTVVVLNGAVCKLSALPVGARISVSGGATIGRTSVTAVETAWLGL